MRRLVILGCLALLALYPAVNPWQPYPQAVLLLAFLLAIQATGWNIISGYAGYVSLGHGMFLGLGAYTAGIMSVNFGINPLWVAPIGGVTAVVIALGIGSVALRTKGSAFVIITIAMLLAAQILVTNARGLTQGSDGLALELPFWSRDYQNIPFYYLFLGLLVAAVAFSAWLRRTKFGTGLVAIREDEAKAASIGVNTTRFKVVAYAASAFFIGVAGGTYAYFLTFVSPTGAFSVLGSVTIVLAALVGGRGTLYGPVVGAFLVQLLSEAATVFGGGTQSRVLIFGVALVLVVLFLPKGILPTVQAWWERRRPKPVEYTELQVARGITHVKAPPGKPLLEIRDLSKRFGGLTAVHDASLVVREGTITALIGPNGSGKTTLFNLVTGGLQADDGEIRFDGRRIDRLPPWTRGHLGLGRTYQVTRLFKEMTVRENVVAPLPDGRWRTMLSGAVRGHEAERAGELLDLVGLGKMAGQKAGSLSYGQQKLVELAQVLMLEPRLVLLDEPAGGVNPSLLNRLVEVIREVNARGVTFLVVEHNIPLVLELCDPVIVFSAGSPLVEGPPDLVTRDPLVLDAYLGV